MDKRERELIAQLGIHVDSLTSENESLRRRIQGERSFRDKVQEKSRNTYSVDEFLREIFLQLQKVMSSSRGSIVLRSQNILDAGTHFYVVIQEGISEQDIEAKLISLDKGKYISTVLESGESVVVDSKKTDHHTNSIIVPFGWDGKTQGAVCISNNRGRSDYSEEDRQALISCVRDVEHGIGIIMRERRHLEGIASFVEQKDPYTAAHSRRVAQLGRLIAAADGLSVTEQYVIETYGRLHDMGKIGIPDAILLKNGSLDDQEFLDIKRHPEKGESMLLRYNKSSNGAFKNGRDILRHHHERFDGKGYPDGLGGDDIPRYPRILNIVDSFDAMASNRCYRSALSMNEIVRRIKQGVSKQFDPNYTRLFLDFLPSIAYADIKDQKKVYYSPFAPEALEITADSFLAAKRSDFEKHGYQPAKNFSRAH
ncbi:MAG: HD domain-containing protein [Deltaproteobacteria bacterium]|nr:HD domain-containing protein [Deltaproteobacteria bacterium]